MKQIIYVPVVLFLLSLALASAQTGCFVYPDSELYCSEITLEQAQHECFYNDCDADEMFYLGDSCNDLTKFPNCEKILCKSSCQLEFSGKCTFGKITENKKQEWCSPGCCQFNYYDNNYCGYKNSKWLCDVEASNKEATEFSFDISKSESECYTFCLTNPNVDEAKLELVSRRVIVLPTSPPGKNISNPKVSEVTPIISSFMGWWILGVSILIVLIYCLYRGRNFIRSRLSLNKSIPVTPEVKEDIMPVEVPRTGWVGKLKDLTVMHQHRAKEKQREKFFLETGLAPSKVLDDHILKLRQLVKVHQRDKLFSSESSKPKNNDALTKLRDLAKKK